MGYRQLFHFLVLTNAFAASWQEEIRSLSLEKAEAIALEQNKAFLIAREETKQAQMRKLQAVSRFLPKLDYFAEFRSISKKELFFDVFAAQFPFSHRGYSSIVELSQPLFSLDLIYGLQEKKEETQAFFFSEAQNQNELLKSIRDRYYQAVFYHAALQVDRDTVDYLSYAFEQERQKLEAGNSTIYEVNQSKVALANAISKYYLTLKDLKNARNTLILTMGINPLFENILHLEENEIPIRKIPEICQKLQRVEGKYLLGVECLKEGRELTLFSEEEVLDCVDSALKYRPDLKKDRFQLAALNQRVKELKGTYFPKVAGYVRYSYNDVDLGSQPFGSQDYHLSGGISLSWNLFDSLLRERKIQEAQSKSQAGRLFLQGGIQRVEAEVRNGLYQFEEALFAYISSKEGRELAELARSQAQERLFAGKIAPLEYRDSVNLLKEAKKQEIEASFALISSFYELRYAMGLGVEKKGAAH